MGISIRITAEPIVETIAASSRGYDAARARFVPLLADPARQFSNCALSQLALLIEPGEPDMEHLVRRGIQQRHIPAVRPGPLGAALDQVRESMKKGSYLFSCFNAHQMGWMDLPEHPKVPRFDEQLSRLDQHLDQDNEPTLARVA